MAQAEARRATFVFSQLGGLRLFVKSGEQSTLKTKGCLPLVGERP